jgi:hypothetical protein
MKKNNAYVRLEIAAYIAIFLLAFLIPQCAEAQEMRIEGDSIVVVYPNQKFKVDSLQIENWIQRTDQEIKNIGENIRKIEAEKIKLLEKELELTKRRNEMLTNQSSFFDMRFAYFRLRRQQNASK